MLPTSYPYILTIYDLILAPLYFFIVLYIIRRWKNRYYKNTVYKKYIYPAIIFRMFGCVFLALLYNFYYGYGDTYGYYTGAHQTWNAFVSDPKLAWEIIMSPAKDYSSEAQLIAGEMAYTGFSGSTVAMLKISSVVIIKLWHLFTDWSLVQLTIILGDMDDLYGLYKIISTPL